MSKSFKDKLLAGSMLADPKFAAPDERPVARRDPFYGVERDGDQIVLGLGEHFPRFSVPVATARKLAALIMKKCEEVSDGKESETGEQAGRLN